LCPDNSETMNRSAASLQIFWASFLLAFAVCPTVVLHILSGGLYNLEKAKCKVSVFQDVIDKAEQEIKRLTGLKGGQNVPVNVEELKEKLGKLAQANLDEATFTEKRDIINNLGIRVFPQKT
jgi:hypothetical protein